MPQQVIFPSGTVDYLFSSSFAEISRYGDKEHIIIITDEHIAQLYASLLTGYKMLVLPPAESSKDMTTITELSKQLLKLEATRNTMLVGVGGGVITDITGFLASVYMRGVPFGFVPTTILGMVDAAIGGKNGVNLGMNKNVLGTITQPKFILFDYKFLDTLPDDEWSNGFAEIIKYACLYDGGLYEELKRRNLDYYKSGTGVIDDVIRQCAGWKNKVVAEDERERGVRKLLNFGHTAAHAIENLYELPHGKAVGIGMVIACMISEHETGLNSDTTKDVKELLTKYNLPVRISIDVARAMQLLKMDKKRVDDTVDYILLEAIGKPVIKPMAFDVVEKALAEYESNN